MVATIPAGRDPPAASADPGLERRLEGYAAKLSSDLSRVPADPAARARYLDGLSARLFGASLVFRSLGRELGDYLSAAAGSDYVDPVERLRA